MNRALCLALLAIVGCKKEPPAPGTPPPSKPVEPARPATHFDETWWGQPEDELRAVYQARKELAAGRAPRFAGGHAPLILVRKIDGMEVEIALHAAPPQGLQEIEIVRLGPDFEGEDDCDSDSIALETFISKRAGPPDRNSDTKWTTRTSRISMYCDENLAADFRPPPADGGG